MGQIRAFEQHIAVFGESGSGKTVLLSSFYGAAQEHENIVKSKYNLIAESSNQGTTLDQNYLGMKKSAKAPVPTKLASTSYKMLIKLKRDPATRMTMPKAFDAMRLVWHDYPGEWFEQDVSGPLEAERRVATFRALLESDVAILLVDGQRLLDNAGSEERYLKSLINNYRNQLLLLKDDVLVKGKKLVKFPRIWMLGLSKCDLLPGMTATDFRELVIEKAGGDLIQLHDVLAEFVEASDALAVGEDFVLLSSAKFDSDKIELSTRVGLDLVLPLAAVLPFVRHLKWSETLKLPRNVAIDLMNNAEEMAAALGLVGAIASKLLGSKNKAAAAIRLVVNKVGPETIKFAQGKLSDADRAALIKHNSLGAILVGFHEALDDGQNDQVLRLSAR